MGFSKTEMNGLMVFLPLIVLIIFSPSLYDRYFTVAYEPFEDQRILDSLMIALAQGELPKEEPVFFSFDPNTLSQDSFMLLGLNAGLAQRIVNYRAAKGVFKESKDMAKIYGMSDSVFQSLLPFIQIKRLPIAGPKEVGAKSKSPEKIKPREVSTIEPAERAIAIDINTADSVAFMQLRGIGPVYAGRIVRFRAALGGFYSVKQVGEVYGLSDSLFKTIEKSLSVTDTLLQRINLNLASFKEVNRHPYISYEQTKEIFNNKSRIGKYRSWLDLLGLKSFDSLSAQRLNFYLEFK